MRKKEATYRIDQITIERHNRLFMPGDYSRISEACDAHVTTISTAIAKRQASESVYKAIQNFYIEKERKALELAK